jgi:hypothetical protein
MPTVEHEPLQSDMKTLTNAAAITGATGTILADTDVPINATAQSVTATVTGPFVAGQRFRVREATVGTSVNTITLNFGTFAYESAAAYSFVIRDTANALNTLEFEYVDATRGFKLIGKTEA